MTGAGSGSVVLGHEQEFLGDLVETDGTPDLFEPGRNETIEDIEINNQPVELSQGDTVWTAEAKGGNVEGTITISAGVSADIHSEIEQIVFNDGGTAIQSGLANSARIFVGADYLTGTVDRELLGCIPQSYSIDYEQGEPVSYSLTFAFADDQPDSGSVDLSSATQASNCSTVMWHGADIAIDGTSVEMLQSMSLSIEDIAALQYGASRIAKHGVIRNPGTPTVDLEATLTTPDRLQFASGQATGGIASSLEHRPATITLETEGGTPVSTYNLEQTSPSTHSWSEVLSSDDTTDSLTLDVTGTNAVSIA